AEIGKNVEASIPIVGDVRLILKELYDVVNKGDTDNWISTLKKLKEEHPLKYRDMDEGCNRDIDDGYSFVKPQYLVTLLSEIAGEDTIITTEVGQNQIWAANYYNIKKPRTFITSGGMGTMGYG